VAREHGSPLYSTNTGAVFLRGIESMRRCAILPWVFVAVAVADARAQVPEDPVVVLTAQLEEAVRLGEAEALAPLLSVQADEDAIGRFANAWLTPGVTRVIVKERDRVGLAEGGARLVLDAFVQTGRQARVGTWQVDAREEPVAWRITAIKTLGSIEGLNRLALDGSRQFDAQNLHVTAEDFELVLPRGAVFVAEVPGGPTAVVLVGRGEMIFSPSPEVERGQVALYAGSPTLRTSFDAAFLRLHPAEFGSHLTEASLTPARVDRRQLQRAQQMFRDSVGNSFAVDLGDLSPEFWWLVPSFGDFVAEVHTRRFGTLTYARIGNEPEDISLFNRARRRNISVYASHARLASRGPFFDEDDQQPLDVLDYSVDVALTPDRTWFDGRARLRVRVRGDAVSSITLKLASTLTVRSVTSDSGRLLFLRVRNQDSLIVNLPGILTRDTEFTVTISYAGRVEPQSLEQELIAVQQTIREERVVEPEASLLYSNRSYWYPQTAVSDYASATIRLSVPTLFGAVCTGEPAGGSPVTIKTPSGDARLLFVFAASRPVRYLACVVSRITPAESRTVRLPPDEASAAPSSGSPSQQVELQLSAYSTSRQRGRARELLERTQEIASFYAELLHDVPYPSFTLAVLESHVPGGHSPAYFAAFNQPLPTSPFTWRDDPASFDNYPEFFLAHELAHQWWGQAVGWQNYHEQWLSEGFAQYFAAMFAERHRSVEVFDSIIRAMSRWAVSKSDQGAVYLGYRLGHIKNDSRIMRALVYNKAAVVLHMLRRLVGDEVFFRALRRFYDEHRFTKAGTGELRAVFEAESGMTLERFFDRWIFESALPEVTVTSRVEPAAAGQVAVVRIEQRGRVFDFPLTVSLQLSDGSTRDTLVRVTDQVVEQRVPFTGSLRRVLVNRDRAALLGAGD
jgi:hypothetical protein